MGEDPPYGGGGRNEGDNAPVGAAERQTSGRARNRRAMSTTHEKIAKS
jgi:hypothetical protein